MMWPDHGAPLPDGPRGVAFRTITPTPVTTLSFTNAGLFLLIVFPGLISVHVYRLLMPARELKWGDSILEGLFYSAINFVLLLPVLAPLLIGYLPTEHPTRYIVAAVLALLVGPIAWPVVLIVLFRSRWLKRLLQAPYPSAWDFFFSRRLPVFTLVHLNDGDVVAGYWGGESYAGSFPNDGDVYFEEVYAIKDGKPSEPVPWSRGLLIRRDQYRYIELFDLPPQEATP
jgi:hypothetical protein